MKLYTLCKSSAICYIDNVFDASLCNEIISRFDSSSSTSPGTVSNGVINLNAKNTTDLKLEGEEWGDINNLLTNPFSEALNQYGITYPEVKPMINWKSEFLIMKYDQGSGYFNWHTDTDNKHYSEANKVLSIIIYLNDVADGGFTEFRDQEVRVNPVAGRVVIFPSYWTHMHRSTMPESGPKYIINCFMCSKTTL